MIQENSTDKKFGYLSFELSEHSNKKVIVECDYCHEEYETKKKNITKGREFVKKDACIKCKFKKRKDVSMAKFGVENSAQRQEVRDKISEANTERLQSDEFKKQRKRTTWYKYGVEHAIQSEVIQGKRRENRLSR